MSQIHDDEDGLPELSNRKMLQIIMQEIADVRKELKDDIHGIDVRLGKRIDSLASEVHTLRLEVHHNQTTFMRNHSALEKKSGDLGSSEII